MTTSQKRGSYAKTAGRREEILEAAIEVFATHGFRNGSLRQVAERVGMSQAGLLHHFTNKNELLAEVLALRDHRSQEQSNLLAEPGIETLRGMVATIAYNKSMPGLVELHCVLSAEATAADHPAHDYFVERYVWVVEFLTTAFVALASQNKLSPGVNPESAARGLVAVMDGLQVQWLLDRDALDMADETRNYLQPLLTVEL